MNRLSRTWSVFLSCMLVAGAVISCVDDQSPQTGQPVPPLAPPPGVEALFGSLKPPAVTSLVEGFERAGTTTVLMQRQDVEQIGNGYFGTSSIGYGYGDCVLYTDSLYGPGKLLELGYKGTRYTGSCTNSNWPRTGRTTQRLYDIKGSLVPFAVGNEVSFKFDAAANGGNASGVSIAIDVVGKLDRFEGAGVSVDGPIWVLQRNKRINMLYSEKLGMRLLEAVDGESVYEVLNVTPTPEAARYVRNKMDFTDPRSFQAGAAAWLKTDAPQTILANTREMQASARRAESQAKAQSGSGGGFNTFLGIMATAMTGARNPGDVAHNLQRMTLESQLDLPPGSLQTAMPGNAATAGGMSPMSGAGGGGSRGNAQQIAAACSAQCAAPTRACQTNANGAGNQVDCYRAASCECSCFLAHDPGNPSAASWRQCVASNNASAAGLSSNAPHYGIR